MLRQSKGKCQAKKSGVPLDNSSRVMRSQIPASLTFRKSANCAPPKSFVIISAKRQLGRRLCDECDALISGLHCCTTTMCDRFRGVSGFLSACLIFTLCPLSAFGTLAAEAQSNAEALFRKGESALRNGDLTQAEIAFRRVVALDPQSAGAFSNLGVIAMRRQDWPQALADLKKAARLAPKVVGVRLNIGLAYFKEGDYDSAIAPLKSVLRDEPALQPQYLLGLCYFFTGHFSDAVQTLEPLWSQESSNMNFLYVLGAGAHLAGQKELEDRALARLVEVGQDTPEFHLLLGKAHLNRLDYDGAFQEFQHAAEADPKLPFVHFNLGLTLMNKQNFEGARDEFRKDIALEPDVALNYDQLGTVYSYLQQQGEAVKSFREAIKRDAHLASPHFGLAKILQHQKKYRQALAELDIAERLLPSDQHIHFVRGQVLVRLGRKQEAQKEFNLATQILIAQRPHIGEGQAVPSPELTSDQQ
jgi:tetratricopeptide (TPR) repeat protein